MREVILYYAPDDTPHAPLLRGVAKINLKAVVTETNARWTVYQLYGQLREEYAGMAGK